MQHRLLRRAGGALFAATLVLAACGDDDTTVAGDDEPAAATAATGEIAGHSHGEGIEIGDQTPVPTLTVEATPDPASGVNLHVVTTDFTFAPERASTEHVAGEGHAHLYVDGRKVARLYGAWYHLDADLDGGEHELRVELNANDHVPYLVDGEPVEDVVTVTVEDAEETEADTVIDVSVSGGDVEGGGRAQVSLGDTVALRVSSDVADEVHVHGYDVYGEVAAGDTATLAFTADIPGVFEVELEDARLPLLELQVS